MTSIGGKTSLIFNFKKGKKVKYVANEEESSSGSEEVYDSESDEVPGPVPEEEISQEETSDSVEKDEQPIKIMIRKRKFNTVYHLSDIHIEKTNDHNRHIEFIKVRDEIMIIIYQGIKNGEIAIAVICGDIFDAKNNITTESCKILQEFLASFPIPVIVIAGNHDMNMANKNQTDALTAAIGYGTNNIYYLRDSGYYKFGNIWFGVYSLMDDKELNINYLIRKIKKLGSDTDIKIALHHGTLNGAIIDNGFEMKNNKSIKTFAGWDYTLLGDVHKHQYMNKEKTIAYSGSLMIRNFGESLRGHGMIKWNLTDKNKKSKYIEIKNDFGFHTLKVERGKIITSLEEITKNPHIKIQYADTTPEELKEIETKLRKKYNVIEIFSDPIEIKNTSSAEIEKLKTGVFLSSTVVVQFYKSKYYRGKKIKKRDEYLLAKFHRIYRNRVLGNENSVSVGRWKPRKLYFKNLFCYKGNWGIIFPNGLIGIFGLNGCGKSAIIDVLLIAMYDKSERTSRMGDIVTKDQMDCKIFLEFEQCGVVYCIYREGKVTETEKNGITLRKLKLTTRVWKITDTGSVNMSENGRNITNSKLKQLAGNYDQMITTNTMMQSCGTGFVDEAAKKRLDILNAALQLEKFKTIDILCGKDKLVTGTELKIMTQQKFIGSLEDNKIMYTALNKLEKKLREKLDESERYIIDYSHIKTNEVIQMDTELKKEKVSRRTKLELVNKELQEINIKLKHLLNLNNICYWDEDEIDHLEKELIISHKLEEKITNDSLNAITNSAIKANLLKAAHKIGGKCDLLQKCAREEYAKKRSTILKQEIIVAKNAEHNLEEHQYDKNCKYCCDNKIVKSAQEYKDKLPKMLQEYKALQEECAVLKNAPNKLEKYLKLEEEFNTIEDKRSFDADFEFLQRHRMKKSAGHILIRLQNMKEARKIYFETAKYTAEKKYLEHRINLLKMMGEIDINKIGSLEDTRDELRDNLRKTRDKRIRVYEIIKTQEIHDLAVKKKREENWILTLYKEAVCSRGIPQQLMETHIPEITIQMNSILSKITRCRIKIVTNDDGPEIIYTHDKNGKSVNTYVKVGSGSEKLLVELAFRAAISLRIGNSADILILDESLKSLDTDKIESLKGLLTILNGYFKIVLIISHSEPVKGLVREIWPNKIEKSVWDRVLLSMPKNEGSSSKK